MCHRLFAVLVLLVVGAPVGVKAAPIELQVDQSESSVDVDLCVTLFTPVCDSDTSPVAGTVIVSLDCPIAPGSVTIHDFTLTLTEDIILDLSSILLGQLVSTATAVGLTYADPGNPLPPASLVGDTFTIAGVPANAEGELTYNATGAVCAMLTDWGLPCADTIDLSTL